MAKANRVARAAVRSARGKAVAAAERTGTRTTPQPWATTSVSATAAKQVFGGLLDQVMQGGRVEITKHGKLKAVLISLNELRRLESAPQLDTLTAMFDAQLLRMQGSGQHEAMLRAYQATPQQLGRRAVAAARKRD